MSKSRGKKKPSRQKRLQDDLLKTKLNMEQARLRQFEKEQPIDAPMTLTEWAEKCPPPTEAERDALIEKVTKLHRNFADKIYLDRFEEIRVEERAAYRKWVAQFADQYP